MNAIDLIAFSLRALVASVFIAYGIDKLRSIPGFTRTIRSYRILPDPLTRIAASILPPFEIGLGLLFLFNIALIPVGIALSMLLVLFSALLIRTLHKPQLSMNDCGCHSEPTSPKVALLRNFVLFVATVAVILFVTASSLSTSLLLILLEVVVLVGLLIRLVTQRMRFFHRAFVRVHPFQRHARFAHQERKQQLPVSTVQWSRRFFLRTGIGILVGVSAALFTGRILEVSAYECICTCSISGTSGGTCYYTNYCPPCSEIGYRYYVCNYYCCPPSPRTYCDTTSKFVGNINCL